MGRGTFYLIIANAVLSLVGYMVHFGLGRYLAPAEYGAFGVVINLMTTVNLLVTSGVPLSASKYIAEDYARAGHIIKYANRIQLIFCAIIFILYFGLAGVIAGIFNDSSLTLYIRVSSFAIPAYALYFIYGAGYLNGLRRFGRQALTSLGNSVIKVTAVFTLVLFGFGVSGAIGGYVIAALVGFLLAWSLLGRPKKNKDSFDWHKLVTFGASTTGFAVAFFLLMSLDLFAVKALGETQVKVGYYTSATTVSRASYSLFAGLAMSLFPSISKSTSADNAELTKSYIRQSVRYMLILLIPFVLLISATSKDLLTLVYSSRYLEAAEPLAILAFGLGFLTVFFVLAHAIMGSGKPMTVLLIALFLVALDIGLNIFLIPKYGIVGAAWATTITGFWGTCAAVVYALWRFRVLVSPKSLGRICLASLVIYVIALQVSLPPLWLPLIYIGLFVLYTGILLLTKELTSQDLKTLKKIVISKYR